MAPVHDQPTRSIDVYLCYHEEAGHYFVPRQAIHDSKWREREHLMKPGTENFEAILKKFKQGHPSFEVIRHSGESHFVNYATC